MVWPPLTTQSTPSDLRISAMPEPAATATKPRGLAGCACSSLSDSLRSSDSSSMLWMKTSATWPRSVM